MSEPIYAVIGLILFFLLLPPKWDPAIRIKEWQIRKGIHPETYCRHNNPFDACVHCEDERHG